MNVPARATGCVLLCLAFACGGAAELETRHSSSQALVASSASVLFIGNSLIATQTNATHEDMPAVLSRMATSRSKALTVRKSIDLGQTLQHNWDSGLPQPFLTGATKWDYIVLQEYSTVPVQQTTLFLNTVLSTYQPSVQRSLKADTGTVLLFENWALVSPVYPYTRAGYTSLLDETYAELSRQLSTPNLIAPLSTAFERVFATKPLSYLFNPDGKHPNDAAIYLNAAMFYGIVFRESPVGLPSLYLPAGDAAFLQDIAAQVLEATIFAGGTPADAGTQPDAGTDAGSDAGTPIVDPGMQDQPVAVSSAGGCASGGVAPFWVIAAGALVLFARRRR
jgi:hypothetical protein